LARPGLPFAAGRVGAPAAAASRSATNRVVNPPSILIRMKNFGLVSRTAAAVALALASWCVQAEDAASAPAKEGARPEVVTPLKEADALRQQGHFDDALAKIKQAEATPNLSPYERFFIDRMKAAIGLASKNNELAIASLNDALSLNRFTPEEQRSALLALTQIYYNSNDYPHAIEDAHRYYEAGGTEPAVQTMLTNALYLSGNYAGAIPELKKTVQSQIAAGQAPSEQTLRMLASAQAKVNDDAGYVQTVELLAEHYPKPELWADLTSRVVGGEGFPESLRLDGYRVRLATGVLKNGDQYADMAQSALQAGFPEEASKVIEQGYARGLMGSGPNAKAQNALRNEARKSAAADAAVLQSAAPKSADAMANLGVALATAGQPDKGVAMLQQALGKGGLKHPDEAKLHLGLAQWMAGQKDAALQTLQGLEGNNSPIGRLAHLWVLFLKSPNGQGATIL
jgi:predicted Zn-dependent protease